MMSDGGKAMQSNVELNQQMDNRPSFDQALQDDREGGEIVGRQSQGIQGRVSQGGLSLRASEGRFSNQNQGIILQDSLDK